LLNDKSKCFSSGKLKKLITVIVINANIVIVNCH